MYVYNSIKALSEVEQQTGVTLTGKHLETTFGPWRLHSRV